MSDLLDRVVKNAIITGYSITNADHGCLTMWLNLKHEDGEQEFGGYALYLLKDCKYHRKLSPAGHFINRVMEVVDVSSLKDITGKAIRISIDGNGIGAIIKGIGHIIKDDWFYPSEDFKDIL
jgi:hypothetical protein